MRILVLSSYHSGQPWGDDFIYSLKSALQNEDKQVEFYIEYMDTERHSHMGHLQHLFNIYEYRYQHMHLDCIVSFGDEALEFLRRHGLQLFKNAPVVFAGVSDSKRERLGGYDHFTGVTIRVDAARLLNLIGRLHPDMKRLLLIADDTGGSLRLRGAVERAKGLLCPGCLEIRQSEDASTADLLDAVGSLKSDSVILFVGCSRDKSGLYFSSRWCLRRVADRSEAPIYAMLDSYLERGIIGGDLYSAGELGRKAAALVSRILAGAHPRSLPIEVLDKGHFMFDAGRLARFGISTAALPEGSKIVNQKIGFYERYRTQIWISIGVFAAQGMTIILLVLAMLRRGRAEQALLQTKQVLNLAVKGADLGLWSLDVPSSTVTTNERWAELFGYQPRKIDIDYDRWLSLIHPEDRAAFATALESHLIGEISVFRAEHRMIAKDGSVRWIISRGKVVVRDAADGKTPIRVAGTQLDITDQRDAEVQRNELKEQLVQRQKIESIGELAGGIAHDFNNLLSPILGYSDIALEGLEPDDPLFEDLEEIRAAGRRAKELVAKLLAFGRKQILAPENINLNNVTEEMTAMLRHLVRADVNIEFNLKPDLRPVHADPVHIQQILVNLVVNACDAMPNGGKITIETMNADAPDSIAADLPRNHEHVLLRVTDTGTGMSDEIKEKIFVPFFTTKEKGHGTGLGLATVYSVVKQHEGNIFVHSAPGKGTRFDIFFPCSKEPATSVAAAIPPVMLNHFEKTVLLAEDDNVVRKLIVEVLTRRGYNVLAAEDGQAALSILRDYRGDVHLVLTDVIMPRMNGRVLQRSIATLRPGTPVAFISGYSDNVLGNQGVIEDDTMLLNKPFSVSELLAFVDKALRERPLSEQAAAAAGE